MTRLVTVEVSEDAIRLLGGGERQFARKMFETAVVKWFDEGRISQGQAATMLGLKRGEFFDVLAEHKISPIQLTPQELDEEFKRR